MTATQDYDGFDPDWNMGFTVAACMRQDEAEHIASWHPLVALAVADWLEAEAANAEAYASHENWLGAPSGHALKIARAYLGEVAG